MKVTSVLVSVKPEFIDDFIKITVKNHLASRNEPGNMRFDVLQNRENPTSFLLYEAYESDEASAAHKHTDHYLTWKKEVADWMAEPRKGIHYNVIQPIDRSSW